MGAGVSAALLCLALQSLPSQAAAAQTAASGSSARCDLPRVDARGLSWEQFSEAARGWRGSPGVILTGLFESKSLSRWQRKPVLRKYGNESFHADDTRGSYSFPTLVDYVSSQSPERMIFVSDTLKGAFGAAWRFAVKPPRRKLLQDFAERPIFSVGVEGSGVPRHGAHAETWHALLSGKKAWWIASPSSAPGFLGWENPCAHIQESRPAERVHGVHYCEQQAGEVLYFGAGFDHASCSLTAFSLAVGAQGHTESWPELLRAANRGDLEATRRQLAEAGHLAEAAPMHTTAGSYGHGPLHRAALHGHAPVVADLLAQRADAAARDAEGLSPAFLAAFSGHVEVLEALAQRGRGVKLAAQQDPQGATPLQWAATQGHLAVVQALVANHGAKASARDASGGGPVSAAATMGHSEVLQYLQLHGGSLEEADSQGMRPLHWATLHGHAEVVRLLLASRAHPAPRAVDGRRPLDIASSNKNDLLKSLLRSKARSGSKRSEL